MNRILRRSPIRKSIDCQRCLSALMVTASLLMVSEAVVAQPQSTIGQPSADPEVAWRLIDQLGSPVFVEREAARRRLLKMRNQAYDVLLEARHHENAEVRLAVRTLLDAVDISWLHESDPDAVASLLKGYGEKGANERKSIVAQLARMEESWDCGVLIRIVRFDGSEAISKWAALAVMQRCGARAEDPLWRARLVEDVRGSRRTAAHWLSLFPAIVVDLPSAAPEFEKLIQAEFELASRDSSDATNDPQLSLALARWYIQLKLSQTPDADVASLIDPMAWLISASEPAIKEHLDWLSMLGQWQSIVDWSTAQGERLEDWPEVQFRVAEAHRQLGQTEAARSRSLLGLEALPTGLEDRETIAHGLFAMHYPVWAIEVLKSNLTQTDPGTEMDWRMRVDAALWLEDQCRWSEAADVLNTAIQHADSRIDGWNSIPNTQAQALMRSEQLRLAALAFAQEQPSDVAGYRDLLDEALQRSPQDLRLLTLRYNLCRQASPTEIGPWQQRIDIQIGRLQDRIRRIEQDLGRFPIPNVRLQLERELIARRITLANLLADTGGDAKQAVALCEQALALAPEDAEVWSAMAHSLHAAHELNRAIEAQSEALARRPQSVQLARYEAKLQTLARQQQPESLQR